jgi:hypothetical protein
MNSFDIELFEYAKELVLQRSTELLPLLEQIINMGNNQFKGIASSQCARLPRTFISTYRSTFGMFQPPGHKGP